MLIFDPDFNEINMAKIVFLMDTEEGHIIPSFGLANSLKRNGHVVTYLSILDNEGLVREQGFDFYPILEKIYYKGYKKKHKETMRLQGVRNNVGELEKEYIEHIDNLIKGAYDDLLKQIGADLYIISTFLHTDTLIMHYKYNISPVIFTPFLRESGRTPSSDCHDYFNNVPPEEILKVIDSFGEQGINLTSLTQLVEPMDSFCEIVVCPRELDIIQHSVRNNVHYIGPSIRNEIIEENDDPYQDIPPGKQIIFASMGSQAARYGETSTLFFNKLIRIMRTAELGGCHLILALGSDFSIDGLELLPTNVSIKKWVPQISILQKASLAIMHGGLGSIKECIYFGVPMIIFPMGYDQPLNARRVQYHGLGLEGNIEDISETELKNHILYVKDDSEIRNNIDRMRCVFVEKEHSDLGTAIIEKILVER